MLTNIQIQDITNQKILISDLTDEDLLEFCKFANQRYRDGSPIISDEDMILYMLLSYQKDFQTILFCKKLKMKM